jgi:hypothetical protein
MSTKKKSKPAKKASKPAKQKQLRPKTARSHIAEGTRLYAVAGRSTKADFVKVYGPEGTSNDLGTASQGRC